jgi:uncharacterized protein (TIGR03382 family)
MRLFRIGLLVCFLAATAARATQTPDVAVNPQHVSIKPGTSLTLSVQTAANGAQGSFNLSTTGLPPLVTATFSPASVTMGQGSSMTLDVDARASTGSWTYVVVATGPSSNYQAAASVTVDNGSSGCPAGYHDVNGTCVPDSGCSSTSPVGSLAALAAAALVIAFRRRAARS